jgi:hypothetical protein
VGVGMISGMLLGSFWMILDMENGVRGEKREFAKRLFYPLFCTGKSKVGVSEIATLWLPGKTCVTSKTEGDFLMAVGRQKCWKWPHFGSILAARIA